MNHGIYVQRIHMWRFNISLEMCSLDAVFRVHLLGRGSLTHCGLVMPYDDIDLDEHWFR